jgi:hypothetical protein
LHVVPEQHSLSLPQVDPSPWHGLPQLLVAQPRPAQQSLLAPHGWPPGVHSAKTQRLSRHRKGEQQSLVLSQLPCSAWQSTRTRQVPFWHTPPQQSPSPRQPSPSTRQPPTQANAWQRRPVLQQSLPEAHSPPSTGLHAQVPPRQAKEQQSPFTSQVWPTGRQPGSGRRVAGQAASRRARAPQRR